MSANRRFRAPRALTPDELESSLSHVPPILDVHQAARLIGVAPSTLYSMVSRRELTDCVKRGKPLRFWRDRLVCEFFRA